MDMSRTANVDGLLHDLERGRLSLTRREAAKALARLPASNERIVSALLIAQASDRDPSVKDATTQALAAPVHHGVLERNPDLRTAASCPNCGQAGNVTKVRLVATEHVSQQTTLAHKLRLQRLRWRLGMPLSPEDKLARVQNSIYSLGYILIGGPISAFAYYVAEIAQERIEWLVADYLPTVLVVAVILGLAVALWEKLRAAHSTGAADSSEGPLVEQPVDRQTPARPGCLQVVVIVVGGGLLEELVEGLSPQIMLAAALLGVSLCIVAALVGRQLAATAREAMPQWERAAERWEQLLYCAACDGVFVPGQARLVPAREMRAYLYESDITEPGGYTSY